MSQNTPGSRYIGKERNRAPYHRPDSDNFAPHFSSDTANRAKWH